MNRIRFLADINLEDDNDIKYTNEAGRFATLQAITATDDPEFFDLILEDGRRLSGVNRALFNVHSGTITPCQTKKSKSVSETDLEPQE